MDSERYKSGVFIKSCVLIITSTSLYIHGPGGPTSISGNKQTLSTGLDPGVLYSHGDID